MLSRFGDHVTRNAINLAFALWPIWLLFSAWIGGNRLWISYLTSFPDHSTAAFILARRA